MCASVQIYLQQKDAKAVGIAKEALKTAEAALLLAHKSHEVSAIELIQIQKAQRKLAHAQIELIRAQRQHYLNAA